MKIKFGCEATLVANRIKKLMEGNYYVCNKDKTYRKLAFRDIVILLRTTNEVAETYEKAISEINYPVFCDVSSNYFESIEIQTIMNLLRVIDNPTNDIPLVAILKSMIGNFTDNELVEIRLQNKNTSFYSALCQAKNSENSELKNKVNSFLILLERLQEKQEYMNLDELIWDIYEETGYYNYVSLMPNGNLKTANLKMLFEKAKKYEQASFKGLYNFINYIDKINKNNNDMGSAKLIGENENVIRIMSIHKSKGLEFPVVFLCGTGKHFNFKDLNQSILLHQDLGLGPQYINYERKIKYDTLAKEAIKIKAKNEIIAEEMRILYVALTRSREKLIITGIDKNLKKSLKEKNDFLSLINENEQIPEYITKKATSYLDWIELITIKENSKDIIEIKNYKRKEIEKSNENNTKNYSSINKLEMQSEKYEEINKLLSWKYPNSVLTKIEGKSSVSKVSKEKEKIEISKKLKILQESEKLNKAEIGSLTHLVLQKLDFSKEYNEGEVKKLLETLIQKDIITIKQSEAIDIRKIVKFTETELYKQISNATKIYKEQPFYINIPIKEVYGENSNEKILVQGIIDLYYVTERGEIVLIDYKTDYVPENNENYLIEKYREQLLLYKKALEQSLKKEVSKTYIYSTFLEKRFTVN